MPGGGQGLSLVSQKGIFRAPEGHRQQATHPPSRPGGVRSPLLPREPCPGCARRGGLQAVCSEVGPQGEAGGIPEPQGLGAEADAPLFFPWTLGGSSPLVTGRAPVSLRNTAQRLPWGLSAEGPTCQSRRHRLYPWSQKTSRASEQLSRCTARAEPTLQGAESTEAPRPWNPSSTPREAHAPPEANRGEPELGAAWLLA